MNSSSYSSLGDSMGLFQRQDFQQAQQGQGNADHLFVPLPRGNMQHARENQLNLDPSGGANQHGYAQWPNMGPFWGYAQNASPNQLDMNSSVGFTQGVSAHRPDLGVPMRFVQAVSPDQLSSGSPLGAARYDYAHRAGVDVPWGSTQTIAPNQLGLDSSLETVQHVYSRLKGNAPMGATTFVPPQFHLPCQRTAIFGPTVMITPTASASNNVTNANYVDFGDAGGHCATSHPVASASPAARAGAAAAAAAARAEPMWGIPSAHIHRSTDSRTTLMGSRETASNQAGNDGRDTDSETFETADEQKRELSRVLREVYRKGVQRAKKEISDKITAEVRVTECIFAQPLERNASARAIAHMKHFMAAVLNPLCETPDVAEEAARIWAKVDKAHSGVSPPDSHAERRSLDHGLKEGEGENPRGTLVERLASAAEGILESNSKRAANAGKGTSSSKANGKDGRVFTLSGHTKTLFDGGKECLSYLCSDGQWRLLRDDQLEDAKRRTSALKASEWVETLGTGSKRGGEAVDDRRPKKIKSAKKAKLTADEAAAPAGAKDTTAVSTAVKKIATPTAATATRTASKEATITTTIPPTALDPPSVGGQSSVTAPPPSSGEVGPDAGKTPPLTVELAARNYRRNLSLLASGPNAVIEVPPIPQVPPPAADSTKVADGDAESRVVWLGSQMNNINGWFS